MHLDELRMRAERAKGSSVVYAERSRGQVCLLGPCDAESLQEEMVEVHCSAHPEVRLEEDPKYPWYVLARTGQCSHRLDVSLQLQDGPELWRIQEELKLRRWPEKQQVRYLLGLTCAMSPTLAGRRGLQGRLVSLVL